GHWLAIGNMHRNHLHQIRLAETGVALDDGDLLASEPAIDEPFDVLDFNLGDGSRQRIELRRIVIVFLLGGVALKVLLERFVEITPELISTVTTILELVPRTDPQNIDGLITRHADL